MAATRLPLPLPLIARQRLGLLQRLGTRQLLRSQPSPRHIIEVKIFGQAPVWKADLERAGARHGLVFDIEGLGREEIRVKVGQYLAKLSSAGHSETDELIYYGLAYLRILHEGPDPRYTGC